MDVNVVVYKLQLSHRISNIKNLEHGSQKMSMKKLLVFSCFLSFSFSFAILFHRMIHKNDINKHVSLFFAFEEMFNGFDSDVEVHCIISCHHLKHLNVII